ncbi:MAG: hypothetical protein GF418_15525 [Chitinivibrionales bacterium]|nr:hypothetical protein [Chitinivibrionales bacterium]MBD3397031.1 hypothetical protein [Chitinivibrionales bacterium]
MNVSFLASLFAAGVLCRAAMADYASHMAAGDSARAAFDDATALAHYRAAVEERPGSYEASWKAARALLDIGDRLVDKKKRKEHFLQAEEYARKALSADSSGDEGFLQHGVALGRIALDTSAGEKLRFAREIRRSFEKALSLNPENDRAHHALGIWYREIATLGWLEKTFVDMYLGKVSRDEYARKAAAHLEKAVAINPAYISHRYELGETLEVLKRPREAVRQYKKALSLPVSDADDADIKAQCRERLSDLAGE